MCRKAWQRPTTSDESHVERVIATCRDNDWSLVFALPRYAGTRSSSEVQDLEWSDVDRENNRFTMRQRKLEHHPRCSRHQRRSPGGRCAMMQRSATRSPIAPGIHQAWAGIEAKRRHLRIAEESSRLCRDHTKAGELLESAVDADVRVICTSESIDTAGDDRPGRLHMSQMQHARSNLYTWKRIERAHDGLWARGAAVGSTVIGYKRRPTLRATEGGEWLGSIKFAKAK
jgi:hypothetical protein